jgi:hypothetical protein
MTELQFRALTTSFDDLLLIGKHKRLWNIHGESILRSFRSISGHDFTQGIRIKIGVGDTVIDESHSGMTNRQAMRLIYKSVNIDDTKVLWLLCHELGHRLLGNYKLYVNNSSHKYSRDQANYEMHRMLFVYLIDVIEGAFAADQAADLFSYADDWYYQSEDSFSNTYWQSWTWARKLTKARRHQLTKLLFDQRIIILPLS